MSLQGLTKKDRRALDSTAIERKTFPLAAQWRARLKDEVILVLRKGRRGDPLPPFKDEFGQEHRVGDLAQRYDVTPEGAMAQNPTLDDPYQRARVEKRSMKIAIKAYRKAYQIAKDTQERGEYDEYDEEVYTRPQPRPVQTYSAPIRPIRSSPTQASNVPVSAVLVAMVVVFAGVLMI